MNDNDDDRLTCSLALHSNSGFQHNSGDRAFCLYFVRSHQAGARIDDTATASSKSINSHVADPAQDDVE